MMAVCLLDLFSTIVAKTPHEYFTSNISEHTSTYEEHTSNRSSIRVAHKYIRVTYEYIRIAFEYVLARGNIRVINECIDALTYDGKRVTNMKCTVFLLTFNFYMCSGHGMPWIVT